MSVLTTLFKTYEYALNNDMVGKFDDDKNIILPLFHNSQKSSGNNIVEVSLDKNSNIVSARFLDKGETIIFPVTEDSVSRSSNVAPHPLVDGFKYVMNFDKKKYEAYMDQLNQWIIFCDDDFLKIIYNFLSQDNVFEEIVSVLYRDYKISDNFIVNLIDDSSNKEKLTKIDFSKLTINFKIEDYLDQKDISYNENKELQKKYIDYVNYLNENDVEKKKIICNISGKEDFECIKHRPLIDNARLISQITANNENFYGRFLSPDQTIKIGLNTSQKIILMAKFLLASKNTCRWLGDRSYLVSWFSEDIKNETNFDPTAAIPIYMGGAEEDEEKNTFQIDDLTSKDIVSSIISGYQKFPDDIGSKYYAMIFDKVSNGRVAIKYFKSVDTSILKENLIKWNAKYNWTYRAENKKYVIGYPNLYSILEAAYGIERDGKLILGSSNNSLSKFKNMQMQNMISALLDGRYLPYNVSKMIEENIKNRHKYDSTWNKVKFTALAILKNKEGIKDYMLDRKNTNRSYLYGRLLALYDRIEALTYEKNEQRPTNAQKLWNAYVNSPVTVGFRLQNLIKPYELKLQDSKNYGMYVKIRKEIEEVYDKISSSYDLENHMTNKPLGPSFIYGYEGQLKELFTKVEED